MVPPRTRERLFDALGLLSILLVLLDYLRPGLLLLPTVAAGGDTPCHYPTFTWFHEHLLPQGRLHGWYPGAYLGHPLLLYYFPLPFLLMSALAPFVGLPIAFKLGTALPVFLLPLFSYAGFRLMGFRFPGPLLGAGAAAVFLFHEENPIWGGTIASTLTGEFSYTYGVGLGVLFLGVLYRSYTQDRGPVVPGLLLGLVPFAHGYAVLWAGLASTYFLFASRRPWKTVGFLGVVAVLGFSTAGVLLLPLLTDWGYTTPYADPWITVTTLGLVPAFLWPLFGVGLAGLGLTVALARRRGGVDHRLLFLGHAALMGAGLAAAGPALGVIDVRFVPFAQLAGCLLGGATLGLALERVEGRGLAALGLVLVGLLYGDDRSRVLRSWIDWNYSGLEAKELWPAFRRLNDALEGGLADPRVAVEYNALHERAGSIRMYETLPFFSGRSTLEGVYNQASLTTHAVYYIASELGATSPNPFREIDYSRFDTDAALDHLRFLNVSEVVALSPQLSDALAARKDARLEERIPPYSLYRVEGGSDRYVVPLTAAPLRSPRRGWREKALRWFTRRPLPEAALVFSDDAKVFSPEPDPWLAPPVTPLEPGVTVEETLEAEALTIRTSRPGHPLLVKMAWHPRWRAEGAAGPYLAAPALMVIVPQQETVVLRYARTTGDRLGLALTLTALAGSLAWVGWRWRRSRRPPVPAAAPLRVVPPSCGSIPLETSNLPPPPRRWGGLVPGALLLLLVVARFVHRTPVRGGEGPELYESASRAYAEERFGDAAEYARHAIARSQAPLRDELLCLRGESLLALGRPAEAAEAFSTLLTESPDTPYTAQALFGRSRARTASGDVSGAEEDRRRLRGQYAQTPWAERLGPLSGQ